MRNLRPPPFQQQAQRLKQRGIAALEFALLALFVIVPVFLGSFVFWEVLQTQQVVTRATGDGARQVLRMLQSSSIRNANGTVPTTAAQMYSIAEGKAHDTIVATLTHQLTHVPDVNSRLVVTLQPSGTDQLTLNVSYTRPAVLGGSGGMNFIEPATLKAQSVIQWP